MDVDLGNDELRITLQGSGSESDKNMMYLVIRREDTMGSESEIIAIRKKTEISLWKYEKFCESDDIEVVEVNRNRLHKAFEDIIMKYEGI